MLTKFDPVWARKYHQHVLLFIRDIANPSALDPFFPTWYAASEIIQYRQIVYSIFPCCVGVTRTGTLAVPGQTALSKWVCRISLLFDGFCSKYSYLAGGPNPNGRNQESSSEAIHAYEAIAMFGDASCKLFDSGNPQDSHLLDSARVD